nr:MAG TPA: hypothetical protein [Crassvirales sp.]
MILLINLMKLNMILLFKILLIFFVLIIKE